MSLEEFAQILKEYINNLLREKNEATRADRFRDFIRRAFPEAEVGSVKGYYPELEKYLKWIGAGQVVKGRADSLFGSLVLEFESVLDGPREEEAREQLRRYISIIWSGQAERGQPYEKLTAIATDGLSFIVFRPRPLVLKGPVNIEKVMLEEVDRVDISKLNSEYVHTWLRRYILTAAKELRQVDPDEFAREFGIGSKIFNNVFIILKKGWGNAKAESATLYEQWETNLRIVYGSAVGSEELYIRHTYLATLAKLMVYSAYSGGALPLSRDELSQILDGSIFRKWGIVNFIEEDLFSWVHKVDEGINASLLLASNLAHYDLKAVTLDVFKEIYQGLIDPEARHELGEYYTPDWLAEMIVGDVLSDNPYKSVLDPACGSGTFLASAIAFKKQRIKDLKPAELLNHILENVVGMDVHPLAVIISRATYLITLGPELLEYREGDIVVPVYLSDSLRLPDVSRSPYSGEVFYSIKAGNLTLGIPARIAEDPNISDLTIDALREYAKEIISPGREDDFEYFKSLIISKIPSLEKADHEAVFRPLHRTAQNIAKLIKEKKDTVWGFILKNYYKPIFLSKRKVDAIVGNPPWLSYRFVKSTDYQEFLKDLIVRYYALLPPKKMELITQMELASLFFIRCSDLYLEENGVIGFVMPRSVFVSDQHDVLRSGSYQKIQLGIKRIFDMENLSPLFNVPSCVLIASKGRKTEYPIHATVITGKLPKKNTSLADALSNFGLRQTLINLNHVGERSSLVEEGEVGPIAKGRSEYYKEFRDGACIYPRPLWLVDIIPHKKIGINRRKPLVQTSVSARAKGEYRDVSLQGEVESRFLWAALSGSELVPFGYLDVLINVLPIEAENDRYNILSKNDARARGFDGLADWLEKVEKIWARKRGEKSSRMNIYQWLDYQRKLTSQNPSKKFKVLYNASGTYLVSCIVKNGIMEVAINGTKLQIQGVIADWKTIWYETNDEDEAYYLCAILNAPILDMLIKPIQSKGAFGERDIVKKPLEFPIPKFNSEDKTHEELAKLGRVCSEKVVKVLPALVTKYKSIGVIRREIKRLLKDELGEIDKLARKVLKTKSVSKPLYKSRNLRQWTK